MKNFLKESRQKIELDLMQSPHRHYFSPISYAQKIITEPLVKQYSFGRLIDIGCGYMPYRDLVQGQVEEYHGLDFFPRLPDITFKIDVQDMGEIPDNSYDTVLCIEVLEHIPDPFKACEEMSRIMKPGGNLILSVPHLSRLHDEPYDYYRYTKYGLDYLLKRYGLQTAELYHRGGLLTFIGHQLSTIIIGLTWPIPVIKDIFWFLNSWLITRAFYALDKYLNPGGIYAQGYTIVARKPAE